jgi:hypothetical protein
LYDVEPGVRFHRWEDRLRPASFVFGHPRREWLVKIRAAWTAVVLAIALAALAAPPASADPQKGDVIEISCDALGTLEIVVFSNGSASPGLVLGSNQVGIPYKLHVEGTFTPVEGEPESFVDEFEHPAPRNGRLDHCTFHQEGSDEFGSFELDGEVWISYTPTH